MPAQVASLFPSNNMEWEKRKGAERQDTHIAPVLPERAVTDSPRQEQGHVSACPWVGGRVEKLRAR
jgi:hypothetical protein